MRAELLQLLFVERQDWIQSVYGLILQGLPWPWWLQILKHGMVQPSRQTS